MKGQIHCGDGGGKSGSCSIYRLKVGGGDDDDDSGTCRRWKVTGGRLVILVPRFYLLQVEG